MCIRIKRSSSRRALALGGLLLVAGSAYSQESTAPSQNAPASTEDAPASGPTPKGTPEAAPADGGNRKNAERSALDYLFSAKPEDGSAASEAQGVSGALRDKMQALDALSGVDTLIPPDLESYLNSEQAPDEQIKAYRQQYDKTVELLRQKQPVKAVEQLYELSSYSWDAGISEQLANRILTFWDMQKSQKGLLSDNQRLQEKLRQSTWNADQLGEAAQKSDEERARRSRGRQGSGNSGTQPNGGTTMLPTDQAANDAVTTVMGKLRLTEEYFKTLDTKARLKLNEEQIKQLNEKAKADFADYVATLYNAGRHHHAKLAADFYRVLFADGDLPSELASQAGASTEIIRQVWENVEVFEFKIKEKRVASAAKILREAYLLSRFHPGLQSIPREEKLRVADYYADIQKIQNLIEARNFGDLEILLHRLEAEVVDFDATKPKSLVNAVKRESQMRLGMAKLAAQKGELEKALSEFKAASEAWPENPDLATAADTFFKTQDVINKSTEEFDRAMTEENYRLAFNKQLEFAAAVKGIKEKEDQLRSALEKVKLAETAVEKASFLQQNGDPFGAWETVESAAQAWPDDSKLNKLRADLSVPAAVFVSSLSRARQSEKAGHTGHALTWYLNAQAQYPSSQMANAGIKRLTDKVLKRELLEPVPAPTGAAAKSSM